MKEKISNSDYPSVEQVRYEIVKCIKFLEVGRHAEAAVRLKKLRWKLNNTSGGRK